MHDDPLTPESPGVLAHQKAFDGNGKLARGLAPHFPAPETMDDWHFVNQLNQCRAIAVGVEHFRSHRGRIMGAIVWQINDCWPVTSWAAIDGYGRRKPLWYTLRRVYQPVLLTVQARDGQPRIFVVNDSDSDYVTNLVVERRHVDGTVTAQWRTTTDAPAAAAAQIPIPIEVANPQDPDREFLVVTADTQRATWFFAQDRDFDYPQPRYDVDVAVSASPSSADGVTVKVTAHSLLRDVAILADRLSPDAEVDDMVVTMLPGEVREFRLTGVSGIRSDDIAYPVFRTANDAAGGSAGHWGELPVAAPARNGVTTPS